MNDLAAAKDFYTELLGFDIVQDRDDRVHFSCGGFEFVAFQGDRPAASGEHGVDSSSAIVFEVDDIDATMKKMKARGVGREARCDAESELRISGSAAMFLPGTGPG